MSYGQWIQDDTSENMTFSTWNIGKDAIYIVRRFGACDLT